MKFNDLNIKPLYNSYEDDIIEDFYNYIFHYFHYYDRACAYFDSKILALYAKGLKNIYENDGKIRFIFSYQITPEDYELIRQGYEAKNITDSLNNKINYDELNDEQKNDFNNLAFLISIGIVDIKIAYTKAGIFHDKFGLVYDNDSNCIYFRGSNNETLSAVYYSYESFETSCSWNSDRNDLYKINKHKKIFEDLWNNNVDNILVLDIPEVIKNKIISYSSGKFIDTRQMTFENVLVVDLARNNRIIIKNFLDPNKIEVKDRIFKVFLKRYLEVCENDNLVFKERLSYVEIKKIIKYLTDYSIAKEFDIYVTDKVNDYIRLMDIQIQKRRSLGIDIKEHSDIVINKFNEFSKIIDQEMYRKLRIKQKWNAFHIVSMIRAANFSVPGSGKTSIVYGAFAYLNRKDNLKVDKIIMIGPKNSFISWEEEFLENFGPNGEKKKLSILNCQKYSKKDFVEKLVYESNNYNLILINYEKVDGIKEALINAINEKTLLVFDEIHRIKAINGVWSNAALDICRNAKYKVALTGTPIPNNYSDIYNIFKILYFDEYDSYFKYKPKDLEYANDFMVNMINDQIYPFYCRTTKKDLGIPSPNPDIIVNSNMTVKEKRLFEIIHQKYRDNILSLYIRLLQASNNPKLLTKDLDNNILNNFFYSEEEEIDDSNNITTSIKRNAIVDNELEGLIAEVGMTSKFKKGVDLVEKLVKEHKQVLVWGIFVDTLHMIKQELTKRNISCGLIYGDVDSESRINIINSFKKNEINVLITNPHTLAESVSLHHNCHDAVYFEYSFNLTHMLQSKDRINRLGLKEDDYTQYYYLMLDNGTYYNNSIDNRTYDRLLEKEKVMIESIENTKLTRIDFDDLEDIKKILSEI